MQRMEEWEQIKKEYRETEIPKDGSRQVMEAMVRAKRDRKRFRHLSGYATVAAAMLLVLLLPNVSGSMASAMAEMPVLGGFFRLITIESYTDSTETAVMEAEVPKFEAVMENGSPDTYDGASGVEEQKYAVSMDTAAQTAAPEASVEAVNEEIEAYIEALTDEFQKNKAVGERVSQTVSYEIVTDTEQWFSIRLCAETLKADGYVEYTYYTLKSDTRERVFLTELLPEETDRQKVAQEILRQMDERMEQKGEVFFTEQLEQENVCLIPENQSFYINAEGHLVITFNELEVAPGYMGCVEFEIPDELVPGLD